MEAHSAGLGQGARFTVWLPLANDVEENPSPTEDGRPRARWVTSAGGGRRQGGGGKHGDVVATGRPRSPLREFGAAALRLCREFQPQAVLLDIGLPGQDGYEIARKIRSLPGGAELKLIAVSGYGDEAAVARGRDAGFDHHLIKPADPEKLSILLAGGA